MAAILSLGGGYGGSLFEFITRQFVYEKSKEYGLSIWKEKKFAKLQSKYRDLYNKYKKGFRDSSGKRQLPKLTVYPHDSDSWMFNGHEPRHFPEDMLIHESVDWFLKRQVTRSRVTENLIRKMEEYS